MKIHILLFLLSFTCFSQTIEVKYYNNQLFKSNQIKEYIPKEIKPNYAQNHFSYTLTNCKNQSVFKNDEIIKIFYESDSINEFELYQGFNSQHMMIDETKSTSFDFSSKESSVFKDFSTNILEFERKLDSNKILVRDVLIDWDWQLQKGTEIILGYKCKKATTKKYGTLNTVYYTEELPISDGPFNYSGLPGLILKISSEKYEIIAYEITKKDENVIIEKPKIDNKIYSLEELNHEINRLNKAQFIEITNRRKTN